MAYTYVPNAAPQTNFSRTWASQSVAVIDIDDGLVLYLKNGQRVTDWPASTVKNMTALLVAEMKGDVLDAETVIWQASDDLAAGFSQVGFAAGDVVTWRDLLEGMMKVSGGDACQAAARVIGNELAGNALTSTDGYARFTQEMNAKARSLGMSQSSFVNSHGANAHKVCARDMAVLTGACAQNAVVAGLFASTTYDIIVGGPSPRTISLTNTNPLLSDPDFIFSKTGSLIDSAISLETYALTSVWTAPNGNRLSIATLNAATSPARYDDHNAVAANAVADFPYLAA